MEVVVRRAYTYKRLGSAKPTAARARKATGLARSACQKRRGPLSATRITPASDTRTTTSSPGRISRARALVTKGIRPHRQTAARIGAGPDTRKPAGSARIFDIHVSLLGAQPSSNDGGHTTR